MKFKLNINKWSDWKKEEKNIAKKYLESIKELSPKKLKNSYFLRDVVLYFVSKNKGISTYELSLRIKDVLNLSYNPYKIVSESVSLWIHGQDSVLAYRTPKSIIYTLVDYKK